MTSQSIPVKYQILASASPIVTRIIPALAKEIGLNESIVLLQINFWIESSNTEPHDGDYWTYQSVRKMHKEAFPYWGVATIQRAIESLEKSGYIKTGNYNKRAGDNTRWFALNPEKLAELKSIAVREVEVEAVPKRNTAFQNGTPLNQNGTTLPETTTETTQNKISSADIHGMIGAYLAANRSMATIDYKNKTIRGEATELIKAGITSKQVFDYITDMKRQPFWSDKAVSLHNVLTNITTWLTKQNGNVSETSAMSGIRLLNGKGGAR